MLAHRTTLSLLFCITFLGACSVLPSGKGQINETNDAQPGSFTKPVELIAADMVSAFGQLPGFFPASTTVDMQRSDQQDAFTIAMATALQRANYSVRWISDEDTTSLFQYRTLTEDAPVGASTNTYEVAIGIAQMRRSYAVHDSRRVMPVTPLYMRGVDATGVVLNERIFDEQAPLVEPASQEPPAAPVFIRNQPSSNISAVPVEEQAPGTQRVSPPTQAIQNMAARSLPSEANPVSLLNNQTGEGPVVSLPLFNIPREENVFELGGSNFSDLLSDRKVVTEQVLTFGNDSLRMGSLNKRLVEKMVEQFNPQSDIFSVIGCSLGPTQVKGGNAALALGRAGRVVEALRYAGVANQHILDEGCWAGSGSVENFPHRGVVLSLNRKS